MSLSCPGLTRASIRNKCLVFDGLPGHRRAEATPSVRRLCPAMTKRNHGLNARMGRQSASIILVLMALVLSSCARRGEMPANNAALAEDDDTFCRAGGKVACTTYRTPAPRTACGSSSFPPIAARLSVSSVINTRIDRRLILRPRRGHTHIAVAQRTHLPHAAGDAGLVIQPPRPTRRVAAMGEQALHIGHRRIPATPAPRPQPATHHRVRMPLPVVTYRNT